MSKSWKVAEREFMENLRTKGFWIGVFIVPILYVGAIFAVTWLQEKKDVRHYAILDRSGWVLQEVDARTRFPDLEALSRATADEEGLPQAIRSSELLSDLAKLPEEERAARVDELRESYGAYLLAKGAVADLPEEQRQRLEEMAAERLKELSPEAKSRFAQQQQQLASVVHLVRALADWDDRSRASRFMEQAKLDRYVRVEVAGDPEQLNTMLKAGDIFGYFEIGSDPMSEEAEFRYVSENFTDDSLRDWLGQVVTEVVREKRVKELGLTKGQAKQLLTRVSFSKKRPAVEPSGEVEDVEVADTLMQAAPGVFAYILWMSVFLIAQMLLTNTVEEKSNRIIEVLLSSVSPLQLMTGKIFGIAITGLTMLGSWVAFLLLVVFVGPEIYAPIGTAVQGMGLARIASNPLYLGSFLGYFFMGYLFFASLIVGIGSVCNSLKDAQAMMQPLVGVLVLPLLSIFPVTQDPNGVLAKVLSFIPLFTPFVMMNRVAGPPELWEYIATSVLLVATTYLFFRGAAKVFRIGILMTGKRPGIREIFRWMRAPIGVVPEQQD